MSDIEDRSLLRRRAIGFAAGIGATLLLIGGYLFFLQVVRGVEFRTRASSVARREIPIPAQRGKIFDRTYQPSAGYQPAGVFGGHGARRGAGGRAARPAGAARQPSGSGAAPVGGEGAAPHAAPVPFHRAEAQRGLCHHRHAGRADRLVSRRGVAQRTGARLRRDRVAGARDRLRGRRDPRGTAGAVQRGLHGRRRGRQERRRKTVRVGAARHRRRRPSYRGRARACGHRCLADRGGAAARFRHRADHRLAPAARGRGGARAAHRLGGGTAAHHRRDPGHGLLPVVRSAIVHRRRRPRGIQRRRVRPLVPVHQSRHPRRLPAGERVQDSDDDRAARGTHLVFSATRSRAGANSPTATGSSRTG